jgi:hypothetical protein
LSEIGVAFDKQYILNMWRQGLNVKIEFNIRISDADSIQTPIAAATQDIG